DCGTHRPALILLFAKKFFRGQSGLRIPESVFSNNANLDFSSESSVTPANEVERSNILAPGLTRPLLRHHLLPAFTIPSLRNDWPWEVVSSYISATAPG